MLSTRIAAWLGARHVHYGWVVVAATFLTMLATAGALSAPGVMIVPLQREFGWDTADISSALAVRLALFGLMAPFAAALLNRFGIRPVVTAALLLIVTGITASFAMSQTWQLLLLWGVLCGVGSGMIALVLGATVATRWFSHRRGLVVGLLTASTATGQLVFLPMLAALTERERSGRGQVVDSAIYEAVLAMTESLVTEWTAAGYQRERTGAILPNVAPSNVYPTKDGQTVLIAANQDTVFRRLAAAMGDPALAEDERYATHGARGAVQEELDDLIAQWSATHEADDLLALLEEHGVPAGRTYRAQDMLRDPHFAARGSIVRVPDERFGELAMQNVAPRFSRTPGSVRWTGPDLGEHTREVLTGVLGLTDGEVDALAADGHV